MIEILESIGGIVLYAVRNSIANYTKDFITIEDVHIVHQKDGERHVRNMMQGQEFQSDSTVIKYYMVATSSKNGMMTRTEKWDTALIVCHIAAIKQHFGHVQIVEKDMRK